MSANVSQNYYVLGQAPLDAKIVFKNKQAFIDYTLNNEFFAFNFYKGMLVYLQEEEILCIWEFAYSPIYEENEKILPNNFIYPLGTIYNGLDYSEKAFNLIEIPLNKSNLGQWDLNTNDERTLTIVVDENTISNVFVPEQITQLWQNAEKISFIDGNIQGIKFQGKQIEYFEEFSLLDWDQLTYEIWNPDIAYIQNAKMKVVMVGENIDYTQYQNRILANSFTEAKIIHEAVSAKNKNSIYFLNEEDSFDILIVDNFFVVKKASDFFAKKDASNVSTYSASWRTALDLYSRHQIDLKNNEQDDRLTAIESDNTDQYDLINNLNNELDSERARNDAQDSRLENLEGINYTWSPTNRALTLFDSNGNQLSQVSLVSLDNEGTDLRYNASTLSLELYNADNELLDNIPVSSFIGSVGTQLQLNSNQLQLKDSQGNILSTVAFEISNINGLQTILDSKLDKGTYTGNAQDLKTEIGGKLTKPTTTSNTTSYPFVVGEDGNGNSARLPAGDLGKNFFNSDLSNTTARNHTMNAGITVNTLGNPHTLSGLPNKNTDISNFRKVRVQNTNGLDAVVDSKNLLTDGVTSMTDAEKDAWRLAQRKTGETYSIGQPQVDVILPPVINGNETFKQFITVVGLNLFVNNSTPSTANLEIRRVKDINGNILSTPDVYTGLNIEVSQNNPTILSTSINFSTMPKGYYKAFVTHNGLTNLTSPEFFVGDVISTVALPSPFWVEQINGSPTSISNTQISSNSQSPTTYKSAIVTNASLLQNGFIAEYICEFNGIGSGAGFTGNGTFGIIGSDNVIYGIRIISRYDGLRNSTFMPDSSVMNAIGTIGLINKMYIVYKNDIVTVINQSTGKVKSFIDPSFKTTDKKAYYSMTGVVNNYQNNGSMTFNNIKSL